MATLIIVEGPQGAGKTTLVNKLSKRYGFPVIHRAAPPAKHTDPKVVEEWFADALHMRSPTGLILDRWVYSNRVYARLLKNQPLLPPDAVRALERKVVDAYGRHATIFLTSNATTLARRIARRDKPTMAPLRDPVLIGKVVKAYEKQFNDCSLHKCQLTGSAADVLRAARTFIEETIRS